MREIEQAEVLGTGPGESRHEEGRPVAIRPAAWPRSASGAFLARYYLPPHHLTIPGNSCRLLRDGVEAYPEMLAAIRSARRYVRLETYMFISDAVGELFSRALLEAAARGVHVKVLYDALGSWTSRRDFFATLRAGGVDVRPFNPFSLSRGVRAFLRRDHRKLLVVDGEVAFVGGVNIAEHWAPEGQGGNWRDDVLRIEGPAAHHLERRFVATWRMAFQERFRHWERLRRLRRRWRGYTPAEAPAGSVRLAVLSSRRSIHRAYLHAIVRARRSVLVAAAYFVPDRRLVAALASAAGRGVEVTLMLNAKSDHPLLEHAKRAFYERLLEAGVRIYEWQRCVLHSKTAVVDGVWGTIGSFNLERMSFGWNHEVNAVFTDPSLGAAIERSFREDCGGCLEVDLATFRRRPLWQKLLERFLYLFRKVL